MITFMAQVCFLVHLLSSYDLNQRPEAFGLYGVIIKKPFSPEHQICGGICQRSPGWSDLYHQHHVTHKSYTYTFVLQNDISLLFLTSLPWLLSLNAGHWWRWNLSSAMLFSLLNYTLSARNFKPTSKGLAVIGQLETFKNVILRIFQQSPPQFLHFLVMYASGWHYKVFAVVKRCHKWNSHVWNIKTADPKPTNLLNNLIFCASKQLQKRDHTLNM